jgi:glycosyltransferase involved in cell wall biosynthesis
MQQAKYSIILLVKNGGAYVKECVNSILNQTFTAFTLHVLDNCSTDGTGEWIQSLTDERIIYLPAATPLTIEENWARVKDIPKNEFITLIGHDDILLPHYLETMDQLVTDYHDASLYQTHFYYIDRTSSVIKPCKPMPEKEDGPAFLKSFLTSCIDIMGTGFMMRSKDYDAVGGIPVFYPNLLFSDLELWVRLTGIHYKITAVTTAFCYRLHQSTTKTTPDVKLQLAFEQCVYFLEKLKAKGKDYDKVILQEGISFINHHCMSLSHRLLRTPVQNRKGLTVKAFVKKCKTYADMLVPGNTYNPNQQFKIRLAAIVDSNFIFRKLFLGVKKIYTKPLYN